MSGSEPARAKNTITELEYHRIARELLENRREMDKVKEEASGIRGRRAQILKRAVSIGGDKEALLYLEKLMLLDDDERRHLLDSVVRYAAWSEVSLWSPGVAAEAEQGTMFADDDQTVAQRDAHRAAHLFQDGYTSRKNGFGLDDNPGVAGTSDFASWVEGWRQAEADLKGKPEPAKKATAAKRGKAAEKLAAKPDAKPAGKKKAAPALPPPSTSLN